MFERLLCFRKLNVHSLYVSAGVTSSLCCSFAHTLDLNPENVICLDHLGYLWGKIRHVRSTWEWLMASLGSLSTYRSSNKETPDYVPIFVLGFRFDTSKWQWKAMCSVPILPALWKGEFKAHGFQEVGFGVRQMLHQVLVLSLTGCIIFSTVGSLAVERGL